MPPRNLLLQQVTKFVYGFLLSLILITSFWLTPAYSAGLTYFWKNSNGANTEYDLLGVSYGGGEWVAVGASNTIATSSKGTSWSVYNPVGAYNQWNDAYFDGSQWILVGSFGKIYVSPSSTASTNNWSERSPSFAGNLHAITYGFGKYLAVGSDGEVWVSTNKSSWTEDKKIKANFLQEASRSLTGIAIAGGDGVIVSESGSTYYSAEGVEWTQKNQAATKPLYDVTSGNARFVAVGDERISYSDDGQEWKNIELPGKVLVSVVYGNGKFVAVGLNGVILSSVDGEKWETTETSGTSDHLLSVAYANDLQRFVAVGDGPTIKIQTHNAQLSGLSLSSGTLSPPFASGVISYSATVPDTVSSVTVSPVKEDADSSVQVRVNGGAYTPVTGASSGDLPLQVGANTIEIQAKAQDGVSEKIYKITVTRATPNASPTNITLTNSQIAENVTAGTVIGTLGATDPDSSGPFGFSLVAGDTGAFVIDNTVLKSNAVYNYETKNSYNVTIQATDPGGATYNKPFVITITNANDVPVVSNHTKTGTEDTELAFSETDFTTKFFDEDGTSLSKIRIESLPANGRTMLDDAAIGPTTEISAADLSKLKFMPSSNWNGTTSFTWKGSDGVTYSVSAATVTIQLAGVNDAPTVSNSTKEGTEDTELFFVATDFLAHFSDVDQSDTLQSVQITSLPDKGTVKLSGNAIALNQVIPVADLSKLSFVPPVNWEGTTSISWKGSDGNLYSSDPATLTVQVKTVNDLPTVSDSSKSGNEDVEITFKLAEFTALFADEEGSGLGKIQIVTTPSNGMLKVGNTVLTASDEVKANELDQLRFIPLSNWNGTTAFTWKGSDGIDFSASAATLTLQLAAVNDAPTVSNSTKEGTEDTALLFVADDFLAVFTDVDALEVLTDVKIVSLPEHGALQLNGNLVVKDDEIPTASLSQLKFIPDPDWNGETSFQWKGSDGTAYSVDSAVLAIKIQGINDLPTSSNIQKNGTEDSGATFTADDFTSKFSGGDGDSLSKVQIVSLPVKGTLQLDGNAVSVNQEISVSELANLNFKPDANWSGTTEFDWKGNDGTDYSIASAKVTITITPVDDTPTITPIADQSINEDEESGTISFTVGDEEKAAEELTVTATSSDETLIPVANVILGGNGTSRTIRIKPMANKSGSATITVQVNDGTNTVAESIDVTVIPVNDAPVATNGNLSVTQNQSKQGSLQATDIDGDSLTYTVVQQGAKGNVTVDGSTGAYTYTPSPGSTGNDSFTFKVNDGTTDSNTATVTVTITSLPPPIPVSYPPTISDIGNQTIQEDESTNEIAFTVNDPDTNAHLLSVQASSSNPKLVPNDRIVFGGNDQNRTVQVMTAANQSGTATITVTVSDGQKTATDTFTVTVVEVNDPPVANNQTLVVKTEGETKGTLTASDVEGNALTFVLVKQASKGKVVITNAKKGEFTYTPNQGELGADSFTFKVSDGKADSNVATVSLSREGSNNADLRALKVSSGKLKPSFSAKRTEYTVEVANTVDRLKVTPTTSHKDATVKVNGSAVISGQQSQPIALQAGTNKVEVVVTAPDGTEKMYTIIVERKYDPITEIVLNKKQLTLTVGDQPVILEAEIKPEQNLEHLLVWSSSSPDVATIDQNGKVVPLAKGTAVITVSSPDGTVKDSCIVEVKEGKILALLTDPTMLVLEPDDSATVQVSAFFGNESKRDVTEDVTWTTKDKKVATVSKGKIKAVGKGNTLITASYKGKKATIFVTVYDKLWVDEREVEVTLTRSGSSSYANLKVEGKILEKEDLSVKVAHGKSVYSAKVDQDDMTFTFERKIKVNSSTPKEIELRVKPKGSDEDEQVITLPIELFNPDSIKVKEGRNDSYTISGEVYNPLFINKMEAVADGEVLSIGSIKNNQFELKLAKWKGDKLIVKVTAYNGFVQEYTVETE